MVSSRSPGGTIACNLKKNGASRYGAERGVELSLRRTRGKPAHEGQRFGRGDLAIEPDVLPLHAQRARVADPIERAHDVLPADVAPADAAEVPAAATVAERQMRGQDPVAAVQLAGRVLHVDVHDSLAVALQERDRIDLLPVQMARVE